VLLIVFPLLPLRIILLSPVLPFLASLIIFLILAVQVQVLVQGVLASPFMTL